MASAFGTIRQVKEEADRLGLRSRLRRAADGTASGGGAFDRGHIQYILTNPIYAGRIRHRREVCEGQAGQTFTEIAEVDGTSKRRVQQMIGLAFLAPDIVRDVLDGKQPPGFTSDWFKSHDLPSDWVEQRTLVATL